MLLVDEPSIWREPCSIAMLFEIFGYLHNEGGQGHHYRLAEQRE